MCYSAFSAVKWNYEKHLPHTLVSSGASRSRRGCPDCLRRPAQTLITVANPGFETGDFTGWQKTPAAFGTDLRVTSGNSHTGTYDAAFAGTKVGSYDTISQSLATIAGHSYTVNFYLENLPFSQNQGAASNGFQASFAGVLGYNVTDQSAFSYTDKLFTATAAGPTSTLQFGGYNVPSSYRLDDISVTDNTPSAAPEPSQLSALALSLLAVGTLLLRARKKSARFSASA